MPGVGPQDSEILFLGEAPGPDEDAKGMPFVGRAGTVLRGILAELHIDANKVFMTNMLKCLPTDGDVNKRGVYQFREPKPTEIEACNPYLQAQLKAISPKVVIPLGRVPTWEWYPGVSMGAIHGVIRHTGSYFLAPTYHPSGVARGNAHIRELMVADIRRVCDFAGIATGEIKSVSGL